MKLRAYAKLNLSLYVTGRKDGLHTLDSVMSSIDVYDELEVERGELRTQFDNSQIDENNNTAMTAARLVKEECGLSLSVRIKKRIPMGGGLGGSSADGAAVLVSAERMTGRDLSHLAPKVGSDVLFMMRGGMSRVLGTGDVIKKIDYKSTFTAHVVFCGFCSTAECYDKFDRFVTAHPNANDEFITALERGELPEKYVINDLTEPACLTNATVCETVMKRGCHLTGSGGCVFSLTSSLPGAFEVHYSPVGVEVL